MVDERPDTRKLPIYDGKGIAESHLVQFEIWQRNNGLLDSGATWTALAGAPVAGAIDRTRQNARIEKIIGYFAQSLTEGPLMWFNENYLKNRADGAADRTKAEWEQMKKEFIKIYSKAGANCAEVVTNLVGLKWNPTTTKIIDHMIQFNMHLKGMVLPEEQKIGFLTNTLPYCAQEIIIDCATINDCVEALSKRTVIIKKKYEEEKARTPALDASLATAYYGLQNVGFEKLENTLTDNLKSMTTSISDSLRCVSKDLNKATDSIHFSRPQRRKRLRDSLRYSYDYRSPSTDCSFSRDRYFRDRDRNRYCRNYEDRCRDYYRQRSDSSSDSDYSTSSSDDSDRFRDRLNNSRDNNNDRNETRVCFDCGKTGHLKRNCRASIGEKIAYQKNKIKKLRNGSSRKERYYRLVDLMSDKPQEGTSMDSLHKMFSEMHLISN
jgi:hypothetical protein